MKMFVEPPAIYLHKAPVDFRKSINGLSTIVESEMKLSPFSGALFVFCNRKLDKLKVLYWDRTGFCLWYKRLEQARFKWPRKLSGQTITLSEQQWAWLLDGLDITLMNAGNDQPAARFVKVVLYLALLKALSSLILLSKASKQPSQKSN